jgi:hypothetical protein
MVFLVFEINILERENMCETERVCLAVMRWACIRDVLGSNLDRDICNQDLGFFMILLSHPRHILG